MIARGWHIGASHVTCALPRVVARALTFVLACALLVMALPLQALANYTNASTQYPAARDLQSSAEEGLRSEGLTLHEGAVTGSQILDGTYTIPAYSSSSMCNFYATLEDATNRTNANHAVITVSGGVITATFYMSGAYTALYFGTAEEAAAAAPADGLTPGPGYLVDSNDGYDTGHGPFSVTIDALNGVFTFAAFNGGTQTLARGVWYTRMGSFIASEQFVQAFASGGGGSGANPSTDPDPSTNPDPVVNPDPNQQQQQQQQQQPQQNNEPSAAPVEQQPETQPAATEAEQQPAATPAPIPVKTGKLISVVDPNSKPDETSVHATTEDVLALDMLTPAKVIPFAVVGLVVVSAAVFMMRFRLGLRTPASRGSSAMDGDNDAGNIKSNER